MVKGTAPAPDSYVYYADVFPAALTDAQDFYAKGKFFRQDKTLKNPWFGFFDTNDTSSSSASRIAIYIEDEARYRGAWRTDDEQSGNLNEGDWRPMGTGDNHEGNWEIRYTASNRRFKITIGGKSKERDVPAGAITLNAFGILLPASPSGGGQAKGKLFLDNLEYTAAKPAPIAVDFNIKPGSCPNPLNVKSSGVIPAAILGTEDFDVNMIDAVSVRLNGVAPIRHNYEDVATPVVDGNECECNTDGPDGYLDLTLKFDNQEVVDTLGDVNNGDVLVFTVQGVLIDEVLIEGTDCVKIVGAHKPLNRADINKDGKVDMADLAIFSKNWLESSVIEE